jgi:nitrite reductase (NADH) large subunit
MPRDELARAADIEIAERGGVPTDLSCATRDPNVYAVGEVAAIEGRCYGSSVPATVNGVPARSSRRGGRVRR